MGSEADLSSIICGEEKAQEPLLILGPHSPLVRDDHRSYVT